MKHILRLATATPTTITATSTGTVLKAATACIRVSSTYVPTTITITAITPTTITPTSITAYKAAHSCICVALPSTCTVALVPTVAPCSVSASPATHAQNAQHQMHAQHNHTNTDRERCLHPRLNPQSDCSLQ
eukprot:6334784-Alexandrium_andersonii.AAC.1